MSFEVPEGATPINDCSGLLIPWVQNMRDLNRVEAENISIAQNKYLHKTLSDISNWFQYSELCAIHHSMFGKVWAWAGKQRKSVTSIGVSPSLISSSIAELCEEVLSWSNQPVELTFLERSARIHHRLVQIHPFENGNGRFSRLVADRCLLGWKCLHPIWPESLQNSGKPRKRYIETLQAADRGKYEPLVCLMEDFGAEDPSWKRLFQDKFYRPYVDGINGITLIQALLRRGEGPNYISRNGQYSLHMILKAKIKVQRKLDILKLLIKKGAKVDMIDKSGLTPFQVAVAQGEKELALFLQSMGARPLAPPGIGYAKYYEMFLQLPPNSKM